MITLPANAPVESRQIFYLYQYFFTKLNRDLREAEGLQGPTQDLAAYKAKLQQCKMIFQTSVVLVHRFLDEADRSENLDPALARLAQQMGVIRTQIATAMAQARTLRGRLFPLPIADDGPDSGSDT